MAESARWNNNNNNNNGDSCKNSILKMSCGLALGLIIGGAVLIFVSLLSFFVYCDKARRLRRALDNEKGLINDYNAGCCSSRKDRRAGGEQRGGPFGGYSYGR